MGYALRKPTVLLRVTSDQQGSLAIDGQPVGAGPLVDKEEAGAGTRKVTLLTPPSPILALSIDHPVYEPGLNRTNYKWAPMPPSTRIVIHLTPEQCIYGSVMQGGGLITFGVLIEYLGE